MKAIPVVNLGDFLDGGDPIGRAAKELHAAFSTIGFVYVDNHGVDHRLVESVFDEARKFFQLPEEAKRRHLRLKGTFEGYIAGTFKGKDNQVSLDTEEILSEAWNVTSPRGHYPCDVVPSFRESINRLVPELCRLTKRLLECLAVALGLEREFFVERHRSMFQGAERNLTTFRALYYPAIGGQGARADVMRCGEHSDYGTVTLLLQDDIGGLEVFSENQWISAPSIPGAILVNLGDLMQFWTAKRYVATIHRVRVSEVGQQACRQSIALFVNPDNDVLVAPVDGSEAERPVERAIDYLKRRLYETSLY